MNKPFTQPPPMMPSTHTGSTRLIPSLFTRWLRSLASIFFLAFWLLVGQAQAQVPTITSFSPLSAKPTDAVTITGTNFSTTVTNNIVFFGATRATVTAATATSLTVTVPSGATYAPITVLNTGTTLAAYSKANFNPIYSPAKTSITTSDFSPKQDFATGARPFSVAIGDLDGDGKPDLAVANSNDNTVSVLRNTSTNGSIGSGSFAAKEDFATGTSPYSVAIGDLDGDGKPDLAVVNQNSFTVSVLRNTSTSGSIGSGSFAAKVDFTTGAGPLSVAIGDLDGDGKPDLAVVNQNSNTVSVLRNTSTSGSIGFATKVDFTTGTNPISVAIGDLDGDGKPDLAVANYGIGVNTVSVYHNTSTNGSIESGSFAAKVDFATGTSPVSVAIGDLDGDGKPDLAVANFSYGSGNTVSVLRNTSTSGSIGFATKVDFATGTGPISGTIGDLDGDGKPDLAVANYGTGVNTVSVLRNTSTNGSIGSGSFAAKVDFATGTGPYSLAIGDLDGDGKPDLAVANYGTGVNTVSVLRNAEIVPTITTTGTLTAFSACVGSASTQQSFTVSGSNLTAASIVVTAPNGFEISTMSGSGFGASVTLTQIGGSASGTIYVRMAAATSSPANDNITCTSTGATTQNVAVSGTVNALPTITLGTIPPINVGDMSFTIPYTAPTGSPTTYSISGTGITAVNNASLPSSPITVSLSSPAVNSTIPFTLTVRNAVGCTSNAITGSATVNGGAVTINKIAVGSGFTVVLKSDGTLWAWGIGVSGQMGNGTTAIENTCAIQIGTATDWRDVIAGSNHVLALKNNGTLWAWGSNTYGQLGLGDSGTGTDRTTPTQVGTAIDWKTIAAGQEHSMAIKTNGTLWTWGINSNGQLGLGNAGSGTDRTSPTQVGTDTDWQAMSGGRNFTLALKTNNTLWSWGNNGSGQLGQGNTTSSNLPIQIGTGNNWLAISAGVFNALAIKADGSLWAWGYNLSGELGLGDAGAGTQRLSPTQVGTETNWKEIYGSVAGSNSMALKTNNTLWSWGNNSSGQLGIGNNTSQSTPHQIAGTDWKTANSGSGHAIALKTNEQLWGWGNNVRGALGTGNITSQTSPVASGCEPFIASVSPSPACIGGSITITGDKFTGATAVRIGGTAVSGFTVVSATQIMATVAMGTTSGTVSVTTPQGTGVSTSILTVSTKATITLGTIPPINVGDMSFTIPYTAPTGSPTTYSITGTGITSVYNASLPSSPITVNLSSAANASVIPFTLTVSNAAGCASNTILGGVSVTSGAVVVSKIAPGDGFTVVLKSDSTLWAWGTGSQGQMGNGTNTLANACAIQIGTAKDWVDVAAGGTQVLALKKDGTLWAWGGNSSGQLGLGNNGTGTDRNTPTQVGTATNWKSVVAGRFHSMAIKTDGSLWAWGSNLYTQLGLGDNIARNVPTQVGTATDWKVVYSQDNFSLALKTNGTLWAWGNNTVGQLGQGNITTAHSTPIQVGAGNTWATIATGGSHALAIKTDGTLWAWGSNFNGRLGLGDSGPGTDRTIPTQVGTETNWKEISASMLSGSSYGVKTNNTLFAWGGNSRGSLGIGSTFDANTPQQVTTGTDWKTLSGGGFHVVALKTDDKLWAWGENFTGELGLGYNTEKQTSPVQVGCVPTVSSFSPTTACVGSTITISGTNFTGTSAVRIGGVAVSSFTVVSATQITATVGTGTTGGTISVTNADGTGTSSGTFTLRTPPSITLGAVVSVPNTATRFAIPYTASTELPNQFSISAGTPNALAGFTAISNSNTFSNPFYVPLPVSNTSIPNGTYNFNLSVRNSFNGCVSAAVPVSLEVRNPTEAEIRIKGNGKRIMPTLNNEANDATNYTDFGTVKLTAGTQTFNYLIENTGESPLTLSGTPIVSITGANAADFTVISQPTATTVAGLTTASFEIRFDPSAAGLRTAVVTVANSSTSTPAYNFTIKGTGDATPILEQYPYMVADLATGLNLTPDASPSNFVVMGTKLYFATLTPSAIWETDGTAAGTKRISNQAFTNNPYSLTNVNGTLYFVATTTANGEELYKYDGTAVTLIEVNTGSTSSSPFRLTNINGTLYFQARNTSGLVQMYKIDGNQPVAVSPPSGNASRSFSNLTYVNGILYFREGADIYTTNKLYKYDGANLATEISVNPTVGGNSMVSELVKVNNTLYFTASNTGTNAGRGLYSYDGTTPTLVSEGSYSFLTDFNGTLYFSGSVSGGSRLHKLDGGTVTSIAPTISSASNITTLGSKLYYTAGIQTGTFTFAPVALYSYDGTSTEATLIMNSVGTPSTSRPVGQNLADLNGTLFFTATTTANGNELYKYDGTNAPTLIDIQPGTGSSSPSGLRNLNGVLYFRALNTTTGFELYTHDGTTLTLIDIETGPNPSSPNSFTAYNGNVYMSAGTLANGVEVWKTNGTQAGTQLLKEIGIIINSSDVSPFTNVNDTMYFMAYTAATGYELFKSDGTTVSLAADITAGPNGSGVGMLTNVDGTLYFVTHTAANGSELYKYDGTTATLIDVRAGTGSSYPNNLTNVNGVLYFTATDDTNGQEVFKYDGTNLSVVADISPGTSGSSPSNLMNVNGTLYFTASTPNNSTELFKYDGSTLTMIEIFEGPSSSNPSNFVNLNGVLYFQASYLNDGQGVFKYDGSTLTLLTPGIFGGGNLTNVNGVLYFTGITSANGQELYKYDGNTVSLIELVSDNQGAGSFSNFTNVNGTLYFSANTSANGNELYKYDGNTLSLIDIMVGSSGSNPDNFTNVNGTLYFRAAGINREELYKYDGSNLTLFDLNVGTGASNPNNFRNINGTLYFTANNGINGAELWKSDGTTAGTKMVKDIQPGAVGSFPYMLGLFNSTLFLGATYNPTDTTYGGELWTLGNCTPTNVAVTSAGTNVSFNTEQQASPTTQSCHCDVFNKLITTINATGAIPISGEVSSKVWIDATATASHVQRHYEITPANNPTTATGKVTLYFTQAEFDAFNALSNTDLPSSGNDEIGKANLLIKRYNGTSSNGTGAENTYTGNATVIDPTDTDIVWNATANRWEVSFDAVGFGGYFVSTNLPIITSLSTNTVCEGENITITGSNLSGATAVSIGGSTVAFTMVSTAQITATVAVGTLSGMVSVTTPMGTAVSEGSLTINPKPATPTITADNMSICKGSTAVLTGNCSTANASFRWTTPPFNTNLTSALPSTNQRVITEPGVYKGVCESDKLCLSDEFSITITQATNCNTQSFITISPERPAICPGGSIQMTATGCTGTLTWTSGTSTQTGATVTLSPAATSVYFVQCSTGGAATFTLVVASTTVAVSQSVTTGKERFKAVTTLTSDKKVGSASFTPGANVIYEAGKSITLLPGFTAEQWSVFRAEIKGCNQN